MVNNKEDNPLNDQASESTEDNDIDRQDTFNELSEISLEERIAVADQIGIPVMGMTAAVATGFTRSEDTENSDEVIEEESTDDESKQ